MKKPITWAPLALIVSLALAGCGKSNSANQEVGNAPQATTNLQQQVTQALTADKTLKGAKITVSLQNGSVILDGTVKTIDQKNQAENDARKIIGNVGLMDNIEISP